jgi:hypothetical protein
MTIARPFRNLIKVVRINLISCSGASAVRFDARIAASVVLSNRVPSCGANLQKYLQIAGYLRILARGRKHNFNRKEIETGNGLPSASVANRLHRLRLIHPYIEPNFFRRFAPSANL